MSADGTVGKPPALGLHHLRTFFLGPKGGTMWECWCGAKCDERDEYRSQDFARLAHLKHQLEETETQ